jgi:hypothetical protein
MHRGEKEKGTVPGSDSKIGIFQVSPSADCWGLGINLMQIFHRDFRCYFRETNIGDDGDRNASSSQCLHKTKSHGNAKMDGISTQNPSNIASLKGSDAALVRLSMSPSALQAEIDGYLGPISAHATGTTHFKTTKTTHTTNTARAIHTTEIRQTADGTHTIHKLTNKTTRNIDTTNTTHTTHCCGGNGNPIGSGSGSGSCVIDNSNSDGGVDGSDDSLESSLHSSCVDMKEEEAVTDEDVLNCHFKSVESAERAEEMPGGALSGKEVEIEVEIEQRDRVIAVIRQLLRVTPSERITAHTALHLLQSEGALLECLSLP